MQKTFVLCFILLFSASYVQAEQYIQGYYKSGGISMNGYYKETSCNNTENPYKREAQRAKLNSMLQRACAYADELNVPPVVFFNKTIKSYLKDKAKVCVYDEDIEFESEDIVAVIKDLKYRNRTIADFNPNWVQEFNYTLREYKKDKALKANKEVIAEVSTKSVKEAIAKKELMDFLMYYPQAPDEILYLEITHVASKYNAGGNLIYTLTAFAKDYRAILNGLNTQEMDAIAYDRLQFLASSGSLALEDLPPLIPKMSAQQMDNLVHIVKQREVLAREEAYVTNIPG